MYLAIFFLNTALQHPKLDWIVEKLEVKIKTSSDILENETYYEVSDIGGEHFFIPKPSVYYIKINKIK